MEDQSRYTSSVFDEVIDCEIEKTWKWISTWVTLKEWGVPDENMKIKGEGVGSHRCFSSDVWGGYYEHKLMTLDERTHFMAWNTYMSPEEQPWNDTGYNFVHLTVEGEGKTRFRWYVIQSPKEGKETQKNLDGYLKICKDVVLKFATGE